MWRLAVVFFGGIGGTAPTLVALAKSQVAGNNVEWSTDFATLLKSSGSFLCGISIFFLLGAVVALAHKERDLWKAMLIGISAPALIFAANSESSNQRDSKSLVPNNIMELGWLPATTPSFFSPAYAQEAIQPGSEIKLYISPSSSLSDCASCEVSFFDKSGTLTETIPGNQIRPDTPILLPEDTGQIQFSDEATNPASLDVDILSQLAGSDSSKIQDTAGVRIEIGRDRNFANDFWRALGKTSIMPYDFTVQSISPMQ